MKLTAAISGEQAYTYFCDIHPECGDWLIITPARLEAMAVSGDPEYYFIASHIPEVNDAEWDWEHPIA